MSRNVRTRSRSRTLTGTRTTTSLLGPPVVYSQVATLEDTCGDSYGRPVVDSAFTSKQRKGCLFVNGSGVSNYLPDFTHFKVSYDQYPIAPTTSLDMTQLAAPSGWYLSLVARTNPSRPVMTPPTLIQDLVDIPAMLRNLWRLMLRPKKLLSADELASQYLGFQFGWLPLIEDLRQIMALQSYILKRTKELHQLASGRGLRSRRQLGSSTLEGVTAFTGGPMYGSVSKTDFFYSCFIEKKSWGTIHWFPTTLPSYGHGFDESENARVTRIVLGLTPEGMAKGLWDVIPWTWLLGWFTNVGSYALAHSNTVPAQHSGACFMSEVKLTVKPMALKSVGVLEDSYSLTGNYISTLKTRAVSGSLTPGFSVPFLDTFRLSILTALSIQRFKRWTFLRQQG